MSALNTQIGGTHYKKLKIQPVEYIEQNDLGFLEGCIVKRITRWRTKDGFQDLEKIKHEVDLLMDQEKKKRDARLRAAAQEQVKADPFGGSGTAAAQGYRDVGFFNPPAANKLGGPFMNNKPLSAVGFPMEGEICSGHTDFLS
jgi:hypothetical protein